MRYGVAGKGLKEVNHDQGKRSAEFTEKNFRSVPDLFSLAVFR